MLDGRIDIRLCTCVSGKHAGDYFFSGKGRKSQWTNKLLRGCGHDDLNTDAVILKKADNLRGFVRRNAAANSQCNFHESSCQPLATSFSQAANRLLEAKGLGAKQLDLNSPAQ